MGSHREPNIAQNRKKSCSRGLPESTLQKVTKNDAFWVPSRPQNIGFRAIGVSKIKKSLVSKNDLKMTSKCLQFWMLSGPKITNKSKRTYTRTNTKKSEPWAQNVPQASRKGSQAPNILKTSWQRLPFSYEKVLSPNRGYTQKSYKKRPQSKQSRNNKNQEVSRWRVLRAAHWITCTGGRSRVKRSTVKWSRAQLI